jgi:hypothetical protein
VAVTFEVAGETYDVSEPQAAILAENLRVLSKSELTSASESPVLLATDDDWRSSAQALAESIEEMLVERDHTPLKLEGGAANAAYCVLRLMVGLDTDGTGGLRDALGTPVRDLPRRGRVASRSQDLSRPEMLELLIILFVLAVLTVVLGFAWTGTWWILAPVIAALLGIRVATTRTAGRFAWSVASVVWWAVFLVPAMVLVILVGLLAVAISR